ncbi:MAG: hypothetical protein M0R28_05220 [Pigmentiphaga sp.]|nr:hypothetical protein [Pigmentiphaga sp.]
MKQIQAEGNILFYNTGHALERDRMAELGRVWRAGFIPGLHQAEHRAPLASGLHRLRDLEPDLVLSSAFGGEQGYEEMDEGRWQSHVDRAIEDLWEREAQDPPRTS